MHEIKAAKYRGSLILKVALFTLTVYIITVLIGQQVQIREKQAQLASLHTQIADQQITNDVASHQKANEDVHSDTYVEYVVREVLDYAKPGERVFVYVPGN